ncbi:hypothetical protein ABS768_06295 [Flavobacterium sp. ST-75]|uniref:Lipoprotein n=2 Tax=Flavobacterium rhizophilum TaxID=3163296 RepID=A0ABW8YB66_9FLAO
MKRFIILAISMLFFSCNGVSRNEDDRGGLVEEDASTSSVIDLDTLTETKFADRSEELIYIREYLELKLPEIILKENPEYFRDAQYTFISYGKDYTLLELARKSDKFDFRYHEYMRYIIKNNLHFPFVKSELENNGELSVWGNYTPVNLKERDISSDVNNEEIELPPVVEEKYNPEEQKINGDFNGDGKYEYAYRVLVNQGEGNPIDKGTPDEYEIQFSDKNMLPVKVGCCNFKLINEGDLNNDGADELTILQYPMNGCIGNVKTYTVKNNRGKLLISPFTFYICAELTSTELSEIIVKENGTVYYHEADPNDEYLLNDEGDKIRFERLIKKKAILK